MTGALACVNAHLKLSARPSLELSKLGLSDWKRLLTLTMLVDPYSRKRSL